MGPSVYTKTVCYTLIGLYPPLYPFDCVILQVIVSLRASLKQLRRVLFIVRTGGDIIKAEFMHTKRTNCLTEMKIGIHLEEPQVT